MVTYYLGEPLQVTNMAYDAGEVAAFPPMPASAPPGGCFAIQRHPTHVNEVRLDRPNS